MSMRVTLQPAFVLHSRPYRDTSAIIELFTLAHGRISVLARGVRGQRSKFRGLLRPFVPILVSWSGKTDLMNLSAVETNGQIFEFPGKTLLSAIYLNELLMRLLHRYDPHPQLFIHYQYTLDALQKNEETQLALRLFEKKLLDELGYGLTLIKEAYTGAEIFPEAWYYFDPQQGIKRLLNPRETKIIFQGKNLIALHEENLTTKEDLRAAKQLLRLALESILGDKLKSRELFIIPKH